MNEPSEAGGLNEALRRRYGVTGQSGPVLTIATDAFPTVAVNDAAMDPELHYPAGSKLCVGAWTTAALAANYSYLGLFNPTTSGVIAVVERIMVMGLSAEHYTLRYQASPPTAPSIGYQAGNSRDSRWPLLGGTALQVASHQAAADPGTGIDQLVIETGGGSRTFFGVPIVLAPGGMLWMHPQTINVGISGTFYWRERRMASWEAA